MIFLFGFIVGAIVGVSPSVYFIVKGFNALENDY